MGFFYYFPALDVTVQYRLVECDRHLLIATGMLLLHDRLPLTQPACDSYDKQ